MRRNILLAVDIAPGDPLCHVNGAVDMVRVLVGDSTGQVIVLHELAPSQVGSVQTQSELAGRFP